VDSDSENMFKNEHTVNKLQKPIVYDVAFN